MNASKFQLVAAQGKCKGTLARTMLDLTICQLDYAEASETENYDEIDKIDKEYDKISNYFDSVFANSSEEDIEECKEVIKKFELDVVSDAVVNDGPVDLPIK